MSATWNRPCAKSRRAPASRLTTGRWSDWPASTRTPDHRALGSGVSEARDAFPQASLYGEPWAVGEPRSLVEARQTSQAPGAPPEPVGQGLAGRGVPWRVVVECGSC